MIVSKITGLRKQKTRYFSGFWNLFFDLLQLYFISLS